MAGCQHAVPRLLVIWGASHSNIGAFLENCRMFGVVCEAIFAILVLEMTPLSSQGVGAFAGSRVSRTNIYNIYIMNLVV